MITFLRREKDENLYRFECPGCHCAGEITVPVGERELLNCPDNCGARFIQWTAPGGTPQLRCVVCPVFEQEPRPYYGPMTDTIRRVFGE